MASKENYIPTQDQRVGLMDFSEKAVKFLTFHLGQETYGIEALKVREIIRMTPITRVPRTLPFIPGVINLRGKITAVLDLRTRFGLEVAEATERTCIVVVQFNGGGRDFTVGLVVDEVCEVVDLTDEDFDAPPSFGPDGSVSFIQGMGKLKDKVIILLHIDRILRTNDAAVVEQITEAVQELDRVSQ